MLSELKAAIFDLDGTLIDSMGVWERVDRSFLSNHGFAQDEYYIRALKNMNYRQAAEFTVSYLGIDITPEELFQEWNDTAVWEYGHTIEMKPGAVETLQWCAQQGLGIVLATVSDRLLSDAVLKRHGVYDLFTGFTDEAAADIGKEKPDIYLQAASIAGAPPEECILFEDILKGIRAAKQAGFITCAFEDASQAPDHKMLQQEADHYISTWEEGLALLKRYRGEMTS